MIKWVLLHEYSDVNRLDQIVVLIDNFSLLEFAKQSDPLTADELSLTYQIIRNHKKRKLLAFFNCGEVSGASQKHKHIQFVVLSMNEPPIEIFLQGTNNYDQPNQLTQVPWAHFLLSIHPFIHLNSPNN